MNYVVSTYPTCEGGCLTFASEGYAQWYEESIVVPTIDPVLQNVIPAVPEPSVWVASLFGLIALSIKRGWRAFNKHINDHLDRIDAMREKYK